MWVVLRLGNPAVYPYSTLDAARRRAYDWHGGLVLVGKVDHLQMPEGQPWYPVPGVTLQRVEQFWYNGALIGTAPAPYRERIAPAARSILPPEKRIGDPERNLTQETLDEAFALGYLRGDEYSQRMDAAFAARTQKALDKLLEDLDPGKLRALKPQPPPPARPSTPGFGWPPIAFQKYAPAAAVLVMILGFLLVAIFA